MALSAEEATAALASQVDPSWHEAATRRATKVKRSLRPLAEPWLRADPTVHSERVRLDADRLKAATGMDALSPKDLAVLMRALHPELGDSLAEWWTASRGQPYIGGWFRRAYRAPRHPELTRDVRASVLTRVLTAMGPYRQGPVWLAAWAPFLKYGSAAYLVGSSEAVAGPILAAAIDAGGSGSDEVLRTLLDVGRGEHPVGVMGRHVVIGLLRSSRPEAWEFVERLLQAAQRQEGLRQVILEAADEAHPEAFTRLLDLVLEHDLLRFSATVRAVGVWLGLAVDVERIPLASERVQQLATWRRDPAACRDAIASGDPWSVYVGLCASAMTDVHAASAWAVPLLGHDDRDVRAAALRFLQTTSLTSAEPYFVRVLDDRDLGVAVLAAHFVQSFHHGHVYLDGTFDAVERLLARLPTVPVETADLGVEPVAVSLSRSAVVGILFASRGTRVPERLLVWEPDMGSEERYQLVTAFRDTAAWSPDGRDAVVRLVGDRSSSVSEQAVRALIDHELAPGDEQALEALLTRRSSSLRRGVIGLLAQQPVDRVIASAIRLWNQRDEPRRDAACELLAAAVGARDEARRCAEQLAEDGASERQRELLAPLLVSAGDAEQAAPVVLCDLAGRTPWRTPVPSLPPALDPRAGALLDSLDDLAHGYKDHAVTLHRWDGDVEILLGDLQWLPSAFAWNRDPQALRDDVPSRSDLLLPEVFRSWWEGRPESASPDAPHLLLQVFLSIHDTHLVPGYWHSTTWWTDLLERRAPSSGVMLRHPQICCHVAGWLLLEAATVDVTSRCIDGWEGALADIPESVLATTARIDDEGQPQGAGVDVWYGHGVDWRATAVRDPWTLVVGGLLTRRPDLVSDDHLRRLMGILRWLDTPFSGVRRHVPPARLVLAAARREVATDDDVRDILLDVRGSLLRDLTRRRRDRWVESHPRVVTIADRLRDQIIGLELTRGDLPTVASDAANRLGSIAGADITLDLLMRMGSTALVRGHGYGPGRDVVYSHLIRVSYPGTDDDAGRVLALAQQHRIKDAQLVSLAMYAPQWAAVVEETLGWEGLESAVWWLHAHTKDMQWSVPAEVRETWAALSAERTPLTALDLVEGAVDVDWFHAVHGLLGAQRWSVVEKAGKLASGGSGHRRAQTFADAMLGQVSESVLVERVVGKRNQDAVRALGLVPLPESRSEREEVMVGRYALMREFQRGSSAYGQQKQMSERTAVRVGIENLARTAGFGNPQQFVWAMEAAEVADLVDGPLSVVAGDVEVRLVLDADGAASIDVTKAGRPLKAVPAAMRKDPQIVAMRDRKTALTRQGVRVRADLEAMMVSGDQLDVRDLQGLGDHPVVAPMLRLLVLVDEDGRTMRWSPVGFTDADSRDIAPAGRLRVAHPVDLLHGASWIQWQQLFMTSEWRQPFKQVFRELYVPTDAETTGEPSSARWSGHQVQPRQALALLGKRGWLVDHDEGSVSRVYHRAAVVARITSSNGFLTPAEVELPTLDRVVFTGRGSYAALPVASVPPIVFSETMRDLDLVVSVAHAGGVDPEATESTVEMRAALVRETTRLTKLDNVVLVGSHAVIEGSLGEYSVHLGSGVVHRRPGGAICIIPVDSQRRGRIFLPFADNDPRTAEVVAKVVLLAQDRLIKDPTILEQLR